ncbi:MAG TPA: hypothetical protein VNK95_22040 [Caldilineaceae bacterium]|nr:hypothetical protein [Caldilineaceae bacterium]
MWLIGPLLLLVVVSLIIFVADRRPRLCAETSPWDIARVAGAFTGITGTLSGFAVASAIFMANMRINTGVPEFEIVMGMLLMGFLVLMGTAMMFGTMPNNPPTPTLSTAAAAGEPPSPVLTPFHALQHRMYILANTQYYIGISLAWLALRPLLMALGMETVAGIFSWLLLFVTVAGANRLAMYVTRLTHVRRPVALLIPVLGLCAPLLYRILAVPLWPALWPSSNAILVFALIVCAFGLIGFAVNTANFFSYTEQPLATTGQVLREKLLLVHVQATACAVALLWCAVVFA